ncbi:MAG: 4-(cytidine 5'-diphospho)-2-C-methyl-D-erythritol kinase [Clostridia bacterium]|nr:4-(cytidine 5'-diphospho)-2-C-methyl-D-erythritol kinase [Clostridia bacterium]
MLTARANAKINWSLSITGLGSNGYHDLDMLMQSVSLCDVLTFQPARRLEFIAGGKSAWDEKNLVCRAATLLWDAYHPDSGVSIALFKRIPAMAGLGGGSADAAATLVALNRLWNLGLTTQALCRWGLFLGADLPFCLTGGFQRVRGIGEQLEPLPAPLSPGLVLVMPEAGLSTGAVFSQYDRSPAPLPTDNAAAARALLEGDFAGLDTAAHNDLMPPAQALCPQVSEVLSDMTALGARFARMSGSGSCCFGVFDDPAAAETALKARHPQTWRVETRPCGVEIQE